MAFSKELEESRELMLDFAKLRQITARGEDVLPVVVQDTASLEVLLLAYVNAEALRLSIIEKRAIFWSTSRQELWRKGETSGDMLTLKEVRVNCEQNSLVFLVEKTQKGVCHTHDRDGSTRRSCYYRRMSDEHALEFLAE